MLPVAICFRSVSVTIDKTMHNARIVVDRTGHAANGILNWGSGKLSSAKFRERLALVAQTAPGESRDNSRVWGCHFKVKLAVF